jgi:hypothetical protein
MAVELIGHGRFDAQAALAAGELCPAFFRLRGPEKRK